MWAQIYLQSLQLVCLIEIFVIQFTINFVLKNTELKVNILIKKHFKIVQK